MKLLIAFAAGFAADLIFGDPHGLIHPVQIIGWFIDKIKKILQKMIYGVTFQEMTEAGKERKKAAELTAGFFLAVIIVGGTYLAFFGILLLAGKVHPMLKWGLEAFFIYQILATKSLKRESMKVYRRLKAGDLPGARKEISYLVGRDTADLDESEVAKAAVETIAENTADGVIAPMFYIAIGGAPLGFAYKAVNTLDSMVGYRNEECRYLGCVSARLDDLCNLIPARVAAFLMILASVILRYDPVHAVKIYIRDRYKHLSPNSAQTESVAAGALDIALGGTHYYFGKPVEKPVIGDDLRPVEYEDIRRTNRLLYVSAFLMAAVCCLIIWEWSLLT